MMEGDTGEQWTSTVSRFISRCKHLRITAVLASSQSIKNTSEFFEMLPLSWREAHAHSA